MMTTLNEPPVRREEVPVPEIQEHWIVGAQVPVSPDAAITLAKQHSFQCHRIPRHLNQKSTWRLSNGKLIAMADHYGPALRLSMNRCTSRKAKSGTHD
jgi:hypothetical protein